jgi:hypothetical protein
MLLGIHTRKNTDWVIKIVPDSSFDTTVFTLQVPNCISPRKRRPHKIARTKNSAGRCDPVAASVYFSQSRQLPAV